MEKCRLINEVIEAYFESNKSVSKVSAKDLMPYFIKAGIFEKDRKGGLPIREILRELDDKKMLDLIPYIEVDRKPKNRYWYFTRQEK